MQKVSEYLKTELDSHSIFSHDGVAATLKETTGQDACWPIHSPNTVREIMDARGLGGTLSAKPDERLCFGYQVAESLASKLANYDRGYIEGRGSRFYLAIETLEKAGL